MVIITGSVAYDYIMNFPDAFADHILPDQIHNINLSFIVNKFERRRGGTAGNVSYTMGLLQSSQILFSYAGKDFSEYAKAFRKLKISLQHVPIDKKNYTATGFAMSDRVNNQIWGYFYGAAENNQKLQLKTVATSNDLVLIGPAGTEGPITFARQCVEHKLPYMLDPGFNLTYVSNEDLQFCVTHADYIIGNDYELHIIRDRVKNWKHLFSSKIVITTLGEKGAVIQTPTKEYHIKAVPPTAVVDPTGAGDAWRSGFLAGIEKGFDLQICGQMGSVASAYAIENYGCQEHHFTKKEFAERYRQSFGDLIEL
ncbi:MAG TPA: PfkB family carbohydrate kinase [Candidatus Saccharimonadales bacterium]|nr:PfkB family carbohydrate kinase [Candidatus Saccharimonadales bacterium]